MFCVQSNELYFDHQRFTTKKSVIFEKDSSVESITYGIHSHSHLFAQGLNWYDTDSITEDESWTFNSTSNALFSTYYNNQLCAMSNDQYYFLQVYKSEGKYFKKIGVDQNPQFGIYYVESNDVENLLLPSCEQNFESIIFEEGLGTKHYEYSCNFECGSIQDYAYVPDGSIDPNFCLSDFTSIEENMKLAVIIFPNPTHDYLYLKNQEKEVAYKVIDNTGRILLSGKTEKEINVQSLSSGYYRIVFEDEVNRAFVKM